MGVRMKKRPVARFNERDFARRLRQMRIAFGLTEEQAAKEAGRSVRTWRTYETTGHGRTVAALIRFAKHHKGAIDWDWLLEGGDRHG